jgi:hypothetical protein
VQHQRHPSGHGILHPMRFDRPEEIFVVHLAGLSGDLRCC